MTTVLYSKEEGIARIELNRPDSLNAVDDEMDQALAEVWEDFDQDDDVNVAILSGKGKAFCAGADLKTYIPKWSTATALEIREKSRVGIGGGITRGRHRIYKPVIAAIDGAAIGAGFEMALASDIRIASTSASFGVFEVRMGIHPGDGGLVRLAQICGTGVASDLAMTGRKVSAQEALLLGIVSRLVEPEKLLEEAQTYAEMIISNGQSAVRSVKETLMDIQGRSLDEALKLEALNGYSSPGDYVDLKRRVSKFFK